MDQLEKIQNPFNDVKTVVLSIGSNNGWELDSNGVDKKLAEKISDVFPNANLYILNGSYGWLKLTGASDRVWEDKINKYTSFYEKNDFTIIGTVNKLNEHPRNGDNLLKSFKTWLEIINL